MREQTDHPAACVVSYNVLSERLCKRDEYFACTAKQLATHHRHSLIERQLKRVIAQKSIICLQEVTVQFAGRLAVLFERANYTFVHDPYGHRTTGWMGAAIAFPRDLYSLDTQRIEEPTDARWIHEAAAAERGLSNGCHTDVSEGDWQLVHRAASRPAAHAAAAELGIGIGIGIGSLGRLMLSPLRARMGVACALSAVAAVALLSRHRLRQAPTPVAKTLSTPRCSERLEYFTVLQQPSNRVIALRLIDLRCDRPFWVATYHMPCKFFNPQAMVTFTSLVTQRVQGFAGEEPYILAGDFNFQPDSAMYQFLQKGSLPETHPHFPIASKAIAGKPSKWTLEVRPVRSAYVAACGKEPELTNHATTRQHRTGETRSFTGTIDYIFISDHWLASKAFPTPSLASISKVKSFPTESEPSDHVLIGCLLSVATSARS